MCGMISETDRPLFFFPWPRNMSGVAVCPSQVFSPGYTPYTPDFKLYNKIPNVQITKTANNT